MENRDFNGTIPNGRLNPPDEPDWGEDMEENMSDKMSVDEIKADLAEIEEREDYVLHHDDRVCAIKFGRTALALCSEIEELSSIARDALINIDGVRTECAALKIENEHLRKFVLNLDDKELEDLLTVKAENERLKKLDDPEWDATDAAHPAWWRGEEYGGKQAIRRIRRVMDGEDDGSGVIGDTDAEKIRRDILALKAEVERLKRYERAWEKLRELLSFGHEESLFTFLDDVEKEYGIPQDEKKDGDA